MANIANENTIIDVEEIGSIKLCFGEHFKILNNRSSIKDICMLLNDTMSHTEGRVGINDTQYHIVTRQDSNNKFVTHKIPENTDDICFSLIVEFMPKKNRKIPIAIASFTENDWFRDYDLLRFFHCQGIYEKMLNYYKQVKKIIKNK